MPENISQNGASMWNPGGGRFVPTHCGCLPSPHRSRKRSATTYYTACGQPVDPGGGVCKQHGGQKSMKRMVSPVARKLDPSVKNVRRDAYGTVRENDNHHLEDDWERKQIQRRSTLRLRRHYPPKPCRFGHSSCQWRCKGAVLGACWAYNNDLPCLLSLRREGKAHTQMSDAKECGAPTFEGGCGSRIDDIHARNCFATSMFYQSEEQRLSIVANG